MEYIPLGHTDLMVSRVGFGCAAIGGYDYGRVNDQDSIGAIQAALSNGVNFFDTADIYGIGHSETVLGQALGASRTEAVIATKVGVRYDEATKQTRRDLSPEWIETAVDQSLKRLRIDCIPLYQIHWADPNTPIDATLETLSRCQEAGKVQYIGCCNFNFNDIETMQAIRRLDSLQVPFSLVERDYEETIDSCIKSYDMSIIAYNPLAQGLLTGKFGKETRFAGSDLRRRSALFQGEIFEKNLMVAEHLRILSSQYKRTPAQLAIRWIIQSLSTGIGCTGMKTITQVEDNTDVFGWELCAEDMTHLKNLISTC